MNRLRFFFLNVGHFLDHLFMLVFATAALRLVIEWLQHEILNPCNAAPAATS